MLTECPTALSDGYDLVKTALGAPHHAPLGAADRSSSSPRQRVPGLTVCQSVAAECFLIEHWAALEPTRFGIVIAGEGGVFHRVVCALVYGKQVVWLLA